LVVDNGSEDPTILDYLHNHPDPRLRVRRDVRPFNYSALNNAAVEEAGGELILLLNDDTQVSTPTWLDEMVGHISRPGVGAVGAKLYYDDGTIQHAGVLLGIGGVAGHAYRFWAHDSAGYMGRLLLAQTLSAVTGACMLVRRELWQELGGLEEEHLAVAFNDVDFCLRIREAGWRVVWTPYAELIHHESVTRGPETLRIKEFVAETRFMQRRWGVALERDPAYNPNLTLVYEDWSLAWPPRVAYGGEPAP
jgi:GT2 family glycosyltransferase